MSQGFLLLEWDDAAAGRSRCEEGLALRRVIRDTGAIAWALLEAGHAAWCQGDYGATQSHAVEALALFQEPEGRDGLLSALENLSAVAMARGRKEHAARLAGAVEALRETLELPGALWWRRPRERMSATIRPALGEEAFAAAWEEGRTLSLEEAVRAALAEVRSSSSASA